MIVEATKLDPTDFAPGITSTQFIELLEKAEQHEAVGDFLSAKLALGAMRSRIDGCGFGSDADDWLTWCPSQTHVREAVDAILANLRVRELILRPPGGSLGRLGRAGL